MTYICCDPFMGENWFYHWFNNVYIYAATQSREKTGFIIGLITYICRDPFQGENWFYHWFNNVYMPPPVPGRKLVLSEEYCMMLLSCHWCNVN